MSARPARTPHRDSLTGLPGRADTLEALATAVADCRARGMPLSAIWLDLDRFRAVNDSFGHLGGDAVLARLAARLQDRFGHVARCGRVGGDEFVFLLQGQDREAACALADTMVALLREPIELGGIRLHPTASAGVATLADGEDGFALIERAERAKASAKEAGGDRMVASGDEPAPGRLGVRLARAELLIENQLHSALENGGLALHYQPLVRADGRIEGCEALMRCTVGGETVAPAQFIPVAEKVGLISRLGEWSLHHGALQARRLRDAGLPTRIAINVSRAQLLAPRFTQALHAALLCADVPAALIELELTESLFMDLSGAVQANLQAIREAGVSLAIDDFGTGFSSLAALKDIPAGKLKLDAAFVRVLPDDARALAVVRAVAQLGRALGMTVVAEGVETAAQRDALFEAGVDAIQGFFYAHPMPGIALRDWLQGNRHHA